MSTKAKEGEGRREKGDRKGGSKVDGQQPMADPSAGSAERRVLHDTCIDEGAGRAADGRSISWQY